MFDPGKRILAWIVGAGGVVEKNWARRGWPNAWPALKASTVKDKTRKGYSGEADQTRTGKLQADARNPQIVEATDTYCRVAIPQSQNAYAAAHQFGVVRQWKAPAGKALRHPSREKMFGAHGGGVMPARPVYQVSEDDLQNMANALAHDLLRSEGF
jgi:phage gpG-like protein